jgi:small ligand-binding sensory domain FIST
MRWVSVVSDRPELADSLAEATAAIARQLGPGSPDLLVVFVSQEHLFHYGQVVPTLQKSLAPGTLIGCSAGGVIGGGRELERTPGITLTAAMLPGVQRRLVHLTNEDLPPLDGSPRAWVDTLGVEPGDNPSFIVLADPFSCDARTLLSGLDFAYGQAVKVGGLASGAQSPGGNALFADQRTLRQGALVLVLTGDVVVDAIVAQGCKAIGRLGRVTRCEGHVLHELDGRPPLLVLQETYEQLDGRDQELARTALFLGLSMDELREHPGPGDFLIRNVLGLDPQTGTIAVAAELRQGQTVQFHVRDGVAAAQDLNAVLGRYRERLPDVSPHGALLFSCLGRGEHLYGEPDHDSRAFARRIGDVALGGFFCNGEIGPVGETTYLHGYTSAFGLFRPRSGSRA